MTYQLGSNDTEQHRLELQAQLFNDRHYIQVTDRMNVCEFGCGNGINLWIAQKLTHGHYIGIDIQKEQIDKAKQKAQQLSLTNAAFYTAAGDEVPVEAAWADLSFCHLVLVHNPQPISILQEMVRVAKPGAQILAIEPHNFSHLAYHKPYLNKTYQARIRYMYQQGKGTLDICLQLYHLFHQAQLNNITIQQHSIYCDSRQPEKLKLFYKIWVDMLIIMKDELLENKIISLMDYENALQEAEEIKEGDSVYQNMWIATGYK